MAITSRGIISLSKVRRGAYVWSNTPTNAFYLTYQLSSVMKKIEAIIRLSRFDKIRDALAQIGVNFFTLREVKGFGLQKGKALVYRGSVYDSDFIPRLQIDILTEADKVEQIVEAILGSGRTGQVGDGKIVILDVERIVRIRNGALDANAI